MFLDGTTKGFTSSIFAWKIEYKKFLSGQSVPKIPTTEGFREDRVARMDK